ncbi:hypothetical protein KKB84_01665 [bacterium]|nr:hypothetical protein [bacterium]MBU1152668.1 hypothetical protein [bacterium]MBU2600408.1 hypothetical protein [bacterium]
MSLNLEIFGEYDLKKVEDKLREIKYVKVPAFAKFKPDLKEIKEVAKRYDHYRNIIIIGNGGSITSFWTFYKALAEYKSKKNLYLVSTMDPDFLSSIKERCTSVDTLVIPISKSGNTVGVLEAIFAFEGYSMFPITSEDSGALREIARKRNLEYLTIPQEIGGRFSARTACGYFPAALFDIDIEEIDQGLEEVYEVCKPDNDLSINIALRLATFLYLKDLAGYSEIFHPVYSPQLEGFINLIVQLIHESSGKEGKGQTIYGSLGPESQHHTNQRFFGGKKNVVGFFLNVALNKEQDLKTVVPLDLKDISLGDNKSLAILNNIPLAKALEFEFKGTLEEAKQKKIPTAVLTLDKVEAKRVGEYLGFIQYLAVYASLLRAVNPYDQPQVENSKKISYQLRLEY